MMPWSSRSLVACLVLLSACPADPVPQPAEESSTGPSDTTSTGPGPGTTPQPTTLDSTSSTTGPDDTTSSSTTGPDDTTSSSTTGPDDTSSSGSTSDSTTEGSTTGDPSTSGSTTTGDPSTSESTTGTGTTGPDPCDAGDGPDFMVTNNGFSDYVIDGVNDPPLVVVRGCSYTFTVNAVGHPFFIKTAQVTGAGSQYNDGVVGNGAQNGVITWDVAPDAPDALFYICQFHAPMTGTFTVIDPM